MKLNRKWLRTVICFGLVTALAFSFVACGRDKQEEDPPTPKPPVQKMEIADYVKSLSEDEYTVENLTDSYGLSDPANVGVRKEGRSKGMYEIPADSQFSEDAIFDVEDYISKGKSDTEALTAAINDAKDFQKNGGKVKIKLPDRDLNIDRNSSGLADTTYTLSVAGFDGLYIQGGENTVLTINTGSSWLGGLSFTDCTDLHLENVRLDYSVLPALAGTVKSSDKDALTVTMTVPETQQASLAALSSNQALGGTLYSYIEYDQYTSAPKEGGAFLIRDENVFESVTFSAPATVTVKFKESYRSSFTKPRNGDIVALGFAMYGKNGINFSDCKDVYVENCAVYTCPGMAITVSGVENFYANRFDVALKDDRIMTATADGYHLQACLGEVKITNSIIENTHDDALNIKSGYYYSLNTVDPVARTLTISKKTGAIALPKAGETLKVYAQTDFAERGSFTVESAVAEGASYVVTVKERIKGDVDWTKCVVTNVSAVPRFTFSDNIVRNKRNRGILVQIPGSVVENNTFENVGQGAIMIHSSLDVFNEATMPSDIAVRNNKLINNGYLLYNALRGSIAVFAIAEGGIVAPSGTVSGISIENNFISNSGNAGISLRGVGAPDSAISSNLFYNTGRVSASEMTECAVELENVNEIELVNNYNYNTLGSETFVGINTAGTTDTKTIVLKDNYNLRYKEYDGEVPQFDVIKLDKDVIKIDGDISDWNDVGTAIEMNGSSLATGDEINPADYADVFGVEVARIAWTDEGLYFGFKVRDNKPDYASVLDFWNGDCVEIFMSTVIDMPNADMQLYRNKGDVLQMAFAPTWAGGFTFGNSRTSDKFIDGKAQMRVAVKTVSDGYSGEIFIPFTLADGMKTCIDEGKPVAMAFIFADADRDELNRKRLQVGNVPHFVENYKTKTEKMPQFNFKNGQK